MTDRERRILEAVVQVSGESNGAISVDEPLFETGILESFSLPDLVSALETEFGVRIPDSDLRPQNFASVRSIESYLSRIAGPV